MNHDTNQLHQKAQNLAREFKRAESELIDVLQKLDAKKIFRNLGFTSLFDYCVKSLGLSESVSYNLITVARKSVQVPELKTAISKGQITVSKARRLTPVINELNQEDWLKKAQVLTQKELEKEVAKIAPRTAVPEKATYVTETRVSLQLGVSEELMQKLRRAQDVLSQKNKRPADLEETLQSMTELFLEKQDPINKAERALSKPVKDATKIRDYAKPQYVATKNLSQVRFWEEAPVKAKRKSISARLKHQVILRDKGQCTHVSDSGSRCSNIRWLEVHHIKPVSHGGGNILQNLTTLCSAHHKVTHG